MIRKVTDLPVIEIRISVYDVLAAMKLAENYSDHYAIVGFPSVTQPAHILCDLLGYHLDILTVHSAKEASDTLEYLKENGYRMVVCDRVTHGIARRMELDAFLITSGQRACRRPSIRRSILACGLAVCVRRICSLEASCRNRTDVLLCWMRMGTYSTAARKNCPMA